MTDMPLENKRINSLGLAFKSLLLFLYIYEFNFSAWGFSTFVTSRRIVVFFLVFYIIVKSMFRSDGRRGKIAISLLKYREWRYFRKNLIMAIVLLFQCFMLTLAYGKGAGSPFSEVLIRQIAFGIFPVFLFFELFDSFEEFMMAMLLATVLQGIIILLCLINPSFTAFIDTTFVQDKIARRRWGYAGCIRFSLGLIASMYFVLKKNRAIYNIIFFFLSVIIILIARTGAVFVAVSLFFMLYELNKEGKATKAFNYVASIMALLIVLFAILVYTGSLSGFFQRFSRYANLFQNGAYDEFFSGFTEDTASLPPLSQNWFGTGTVSGYSGNNQLVNIDGGYLRIYAAVGPIMAIVCYISMFRNLINSSSILFDNGVKRLFLVFVAFFAIAEFKEFTIYAQFMFCLFYTAVTLAERDQIAYERYN